MNDNKPPLDWADQAVGFGAGLASALLFAASSHGTGLALLLAYFSPLPLLIGVIGYSTGATLGGVLLGAMALSHLGPPLLGLGFLLGFALPALLVGVLTKRSFLFKGSETGPVPRFLRPGSLLAVNLALSVAAAWIGVLALVRQYGGFDAGLDALLAHYGPALDEAVERLHQISTDIDADTIKKVILMSAPAGIAASQTLLLSVNLWLAARITEISQRLGRPWPALPENLVLPRILAPMFVIAIGLSFDGGLSGVMAGAFAAAAGLALCIQGLAALHAFTRDNRFRLTALTALYAVVFALQPWSFIAFAGFGFVESVLSLRARKARHSHVKNEN
jgi:hypothetical protein